MVFAVYHVHLPGRLCMRRWECVTLHDCAGLFVAILTSSLRFSQIRHLHLGVMIASARDDLALVRGKRSFGFILNFRVHQELPSAERGNMQRVTLEWVPERDDPDYDGRNDDSVKLTGTFWGWGEPKPMARVAKEKNVSLHDGTNHANEGGVRYEVALDLPPGRYEFKFVVERGHSGARWLCSRHYPVCGDSSGVQNNVVEVE